MDHSKQFVCAKHQENKNEQTEKVKLYVSSKKFTDSKHDVFQNST